MEDSEASSPPEVTRLLQQIGQGDDAAAHSLLDLVYDELRHLAGAIRMGSPRGGTLHPTSLVHEVWIKLVGGLGSIEDRRHFFALAARAMRQIIADHARARGAAKRGGGARLLTFHEAPLQGSEAPLDLVAFHDSLERLASLNERQARVMELRLLGGLTIAEAAMMLDVSPATIKTDWAMGRAWLLREMTGDP